MSATRTLGGRIGGLTGVYAAGSALAVIVGLVNLAVLTRFLPPAEFGRYALFLTLSFLLTLVYGLVSFKGSVRTVFGGDDDDGDEDDDEPSGFAENQSRRALGTGLITTAGIAVVGTVLVAALPGVVAALVGEGDEPSTLALWAAVAGGLGAVWRLASMVPRRERRSGLFVFLQTARPVLVLAVTVPLVASGGGVEGAMLGLAIGTAMATVVSLIAIRRSWQPAFELPLLRTIARRGSPYLPLVISFWVIENGGVFILAHTASTVEVGLFRVATQVAAVGAYGVTAFLRASGPLTREPIHKAARQEHGPARMATMMSTYFALATIGLLLLFAVAADVLVRIAPPAYAAAASLVPLIVLSAVFNGWFRVVYRYSRFPRRRPAKISFATVAGVVFLGVSIALAPGLGAYGVAAGMVAGFLAATVGMLVLAQRGEFPIPFARRRIAAALLLATACYGGARALEELMGVPVPVTAILAIVAYPALLVLTRVVPRAHVRPLLHISRAAVPGPRRDGEVKLRRLSTRQRRVLGMLVRDGMRPGEVAPVLGASEEEVVITFVAALRRVGRLGKPARTDARVGSYLLSSAAVADRDLIWKRLAAEGVDPLDTDALNVTLDRVRRASPEVWRAA